MYTQSEILVLCKNNPEAIVEMMEHMIKRGVQYNAIITQLEARVKELESRLNQDNHNSFTNKARTSKDIRALNFFL